MSASTALTEARAGATALVVSGRLGTELTPVLEHGLIPQLDATLADVDEGLLDVAARSTTSMLAAVDAMAGPLGVPPALRPVQDALRRGLAALEA